MVKMVLVKVPFIRAFILISKRMQRIVLKLRSILLQDMLRICATDMRQPQITPALKYILITEMA